MSRTAVPVAVIAAAAALLGLLVYGVVSRGEDRTIDDAVSRGKRISAPHQSLPVLNGPGRQSLSDYRGKVVVLNFWASWCDPCRIEAPALQGLQRRIASRGGTVLGVDFRDTATDARAFMREFNLTYPSLRDTDGWLAKQYGTRALPETFVIDRQGRIAAVSRGTVSRRFLDRNVLPLLSETP